MKKHIAEDSEEIIEGQDFANPKHELLKKPSSHGEVGNQQEGDFSDLEESRMEHPPKHRDGNGSNKNDSDNPKGIDQSTGIDKK